MSKIIKLLNISEKELYSEKSVQAIIQEALAAVKEPPDAKTLTVWGPKFLKLTRKPEFLTQLNENDRLNWSEVCFYIIRYTNFGVRDLMEQRVNEFGRRVLFRDMNLKRDIRWTYRQVYNRMQEVAAMLYRLNVKNLRVALFMENSVDGAVTDLACLSYGIYNTPLNVHFDEETLAHIFEITETSVVITDTVERLEKAKHAASKAGIKPAFIYSGSDANAKRSADYMLAEELATNSLKAATELLSNLPKRKVNRVATTMFTSGSTGMPKGVSFSEYNLVSKRFARAAALPTVGNKEVLICYLPLFHTFGRYLELMGSIFWGGTYVFAGNTSVANLLSLFPRINPTGFISVPLRWVQLYDKCMKSISPQMNDEEVKIIVHSVVGTRLSWGLSAAGYLDPAIFKFFIHNGVFLNSGFGMTEATGGITMTRPGEYIENSTGIPLPGMKTRLKESGELELKSHYLARYYKMPPGSETDIPYPDEDDYWLETGDIFTVDNAGQHEIIDRVKDIYKNNKGQTIAPGRAEKMFTGVPGIKRTFLVGDGKAYNVLLIVPDKGDPIFDSFETEDDEHEYYRQIIMEANKGLAPYERVVNFKLSERDFEESKGELTPKGSYKRKNIIQNFADTVKQLYKSNKIILKYDDYQVIIPRWLFRDLAILETEIIKDKTGLKNTVNKSHLTIEPFGKHTYLIGDLTYTIENDKIDLGRMSRIPVLWVSNPELTKFLPCKDSFELPLKQFSPAVSIPKKRREYSESAKPVLKGISDADLIFLNDLLFSVYYTPEKTALNSLKQVEQLFGTYGKYKSDIARRRLEGLAYHENDTIRMNAYRILMTGDPHPDYSQIFPSFIDSGKPFLNAKIIKEIARGDFGKDQLEAFRKRMHVYRKKFDKKQSKQTEEQFDTIFRLLLQFGLENLSYYGTIRAEFAGWILLKSEPYLSSQALKYLNELYFKFLEYVEQNHKKLSNSVIEKMLVFDEGLTPAEQTTITEKIFSSNFLIQSIILIYDDTGIRLSDIPEHGIWISRTHLYPRKQQYRMVVNTKAGKHFDIHVAVDEQFTNNKNSQALFRSIALSGYPYGAPVVSKFGCINPDAGVFSSKYVNELTAWDKIRSLSELRSADAKQNPNAWRKLFIRSMQTFYLAWDYSNRKIVPGLVSPSNVVVSENDFSYSSKILSVIGWQEQNSPASLFSLLLRNFYFKTESHYPSSKKNLKKRWIFHALAEAFGGKEATRLITDTVKEIEAKENISDLEKTVLSEAEWYLKNKAITYFPLAMFNAIDKYADWSVKSPLASSAAQEQTVSELLDLYDIQKYPELVRYKFYMETFFKNSKNIYEKFEVLILRMVKEPETLPIQFVELSDIQEELQKQSGKDVFAKMVFPKMNTEQTVDFQKTHQRTGEELIVRTHIKDNKALDYVMRKPMHAGEVGRLYKLFYKENYPKKISGMDLHYVVTDNLDQVVGGLCYKVLEENVVLLDGMAINSSLHNRGIGSAMMKNFFTIMKAEGVKTIKAHFLFGNYYLKHQFVVDKEWGALVKNI